MKTFETLRVKRFKLTFKISLICLIAATSIILVNWKPLIENISSTGIFLGFTAGFFLALIIISGGIILSERKKQPPKQKENSLVPKDRERNVVEFFALISIIGIVMGIIFEVLYVIYENSLFDTIAVYGFIAFVFPFVLLQFFMSAGLYGNGLGWIYLLFYLFLFPFVNMFFFSGINILFHIVPTYHYSHNRGTGITMAEIEEFRRQAWLLVAMIYVLFNGAGLLWRIGKNIYNRNKSILLSV
jgi:hypothetical protein